jgi:hypothetical protein
MVEREVPTLFMHKKLSDSVREYGRQRQWKKEFGDCPQTSMGAALRPILAVLRLTCGGLQDLIMAKLARSMEPMRG